VRVDPTHAHRKEVTVCRNLEWPGAWVKQRELIMRQKTQLQRLPSCGLVFRVSMRCVGGAVVRNAGRAGRADGRVPRGLPFGLPGLARRRPF
jgi:hypothetical protein